MGKKSEDEAPLAARRSPQRIAPTGIDLVARAALDDPRGHARRLTRRASRRVDRGDTGDFVRLLERFEQLTGCSTVAVKHGAST
jgi:sulfur transfer complex TusBCD TusB component (DsrH family)